MVSRVSVPLRGELPFPIEQLTYPGPKRAAAVASDAAKWFRSEVEARSNLAFEPRTMAIDAGSATAPHQVRLVDLTTGEERSESFELLVLANTIEGERSWAVDDASYTEAERGTIFRSLDYWDNDTIRGRFTELRHLGAGGQRRPQMLISGAGDGGLQDFIYYSTGERSPREILDHVGDPTPALIEKIMYITLNYERMAYWRSGDKRYDCEILGAYHDVMKDCALRWLAQVGVRSRLEQLLEGHVGVRLVSVCRHFTPAYPLNVFVALAIDAIDAEAGRIVYEHRVEHVGHACASGCGLAEGQGCPLAQDVVLIPDTTCVDRSRGSEPLDPFTCDLILLRHGIRWRRAKEQFEGIDYPVPLWP